MEVKWEVEDGYVGKSGPHYFNIDDDELAEKESEKDKNDYIEECVREQFNDIVSFCWEMVD